MSYSVVELGDTNKTGIETIKEISRGDKSLKELLYTFKTDGVKSVKDLLGGKVTFNEFKTNLNREPQACVGAWGNWSACSNTCGGGTKTREWFVETEETDGGTCVNRGKTEDASCNTQACSTSGGGGGSTPTPTPTPTPTAAPAAKNCTGSWGGYGACSKTCGTGTKSRSWNVTSNETNGGTCAKRNKTESASCNTQACPTVDTTAYEDRAKSTLPSAVQSKINTYGALGTYRRCMGNSYDWNNKSCKKTTGSASDNASPNIYSLYENEWNSGIMEKTIAQHWVANDNGVNCRDLFTYELDQHKQPEGVINNENVEVWRVSAANLYKTDYPGAANVGKDLYCPPLYYKVVT